jgi:hypothetical protein
MIVMSVTMFDDVRADVETICEPRDVVEPCKKWK